MKNNLYHGTKSIVGRRNTQVAMIMLQEVLFIEHTARYKQNHKLKGEVTKSHTVHSEGNVPSHTKPTAHDVN